jgi:hypothetical protein
MKIDMTYGIYNAITKVMEKVSPLAQAGDADALEVLGRLMPVAELLGGQLRRKLSLAIDEMQAKSGGEAQGRARPNQSAAPEAELLERPTKLQRSTCRLRAS